MYKEFECVDCNKNTFQDEYYMVHDELWNKHFEGKGMLCISCLETRVGRELNADDFTDAPVNNIRFIPWKASDLLTMRLMNNGKEF